MGWRAQSPNQFTIIGIGSLHLLAQLTDQTFQSLSPSLWPSYNMFIALLVLRPQNFKPHQIWRVSVCSPNLTSVRMASPGVLAIMMEHYDSLIFQLFPVPCWPILCLRRHHDHGGITLAQQCCPRCSQPESRAH